MSCVTGIPSAAKRQAILDAAIEAFLDSGYAAGVDDIAAKAGVGKQTVYRHFGDKQALFLAAVTAARDRAVRDNAALDGADDGRSSSLKDCRDPRRVLTRIGERILAMTLSPTVAALHRLTIAEIAHHPELGRQWGETAAPYLDLELVAYLRDCDTADTLRVPDPATSARQFAFLLATEGRVASAYGTRPLSAPRRSTVVAETTDLIIRAHRTA